MTTKKFKFEMGQTVKLTPGNKTGEVVGRADYAKSQDEYLIRSVDEGISTETWCNEDALTG